MPPIVFGCGQPLSSCICIKVSLFTGLVCTQVSSKCCYFCPDCCNKLTNSLPFQTYTSTSDVSMHGSSHRKDVQIVQEGFQRFRGTEDCMMPSCSFYNRKTTHFHCIRKNCNYTFKNKADIGELAANLGPL